MNITKEQIRAAGGIVHADGNVFFTSIEQLISIMRGLEDAAPVCNHEWFQTGAMLSNEKRCIQCGEWGKLYTSPQAAQTALQSESSAQAAQALARLPSEGKPIEALAPTEAALREVVRLSEDAGLYDDFQTEAQERPAYTEGDVVGLCVCGSWSGGRCLRCEWRAGSKP